PKGRLAANLTAGLSLGRPVVRHLRRPAGKRTREPVRAARQEPEPAEAVRRGHLISWGKPAVSPMGPFPFWLGAASRFDSKQLIRPGLTRPTRHAWVGGLLRSAVCQWDGFLWFWAYVFGLRADQALVGDLLQDVGRPAGRSRDPEGGREEVRGQADRLQNAGRVELDVGRLGPVRVPFLEQP